MAGSCSHFSQRPAKRPLRYRAVLPQERLLGSRSPRYWNWPAGAGSAVLKIREEIDARPRCQRKADRKKGARQVPLKGLWERLPEADRREISRILAGMMAAQILPLPKKEESHE